MPPGTGMPAARITTLARSFCIAIAEASTPEWRVRHADDLQNALQRAVLARMAVQHVERDIGLQCLQHGRDIAPDVDLGDAVALGLERLGAGLAGAQADLALGRPASHQDRDVLGWHGPPCARADA